MRQEMALSLLGRPSATERIQGVGYTAGIEQPNDATLAALFDAVDKDPNPNVRLAAVEALYLFRDRPGVRESLVKSLSVQTYPLVQVALIDFLVEVREAPGGRGAQERSSRATSSLPMSRSGPNRA